MSRSRVGLGDLIGFVIPLWSRPTSLWWHRRHGCHRVFGHRHRGGHRYRGLFLSSQRLTRIGKPVGEEIVGPGSDQGCGTAYWQVPGPEVAALPLGLMAGRRAPQPISIVASGRFRGALGEAMPTQRADAARWQAGSPGWNHPHPCAGEQCGAYRDIGHRPFGEQ